MRGDLSRNALGEFMLVLLVDFHSMILSSIYHVYIDLKHIHLLYIWIIEVYDIQRSGWTTQDTNSCFLFDKSVSRTNSGCGVVCLNDYTQRKHRACCQQLFFLNIRILLGFSVNFEWQ